MTGAPPPSPARPRARNRTTSRPGRLCTPRSSGSIPAAPPPPAGGRRSPPRGPGGPPAGGGADRRPPAARRVLEAQEGALDEVVAERGCQHGAGEGREREREEAR